MVIDHVFWLRTTYPERLLLVTSILSSTRLRNPYFTIPIRYHVLPHEGTCRGFLEKLDPSHDTRSLYGHMKFDAAVMTKGNISSLLSLKTLITQISKKQNEMTNFLWLEKIRIYIMMGMK